MKRISILAASVLALIGTIGMPMTVQAADCKNQVRVIVAGSNNTQEIKDQLSKYGINLDEVIKNCPPKASQNNGAVTNNNNCYNNNNCKNNSNNNGGQGGGKVNNVNNNPSAAPQTPATPAAPQTPAAPAATQKPASQVPAETTTPAAPVSEAPASLSYQEQVVKLVNEERAKEGLVALTLDSAVQSAAQVRAKETATSFSHSRPNGTSFSTALTEAGVSYRGSGENIAWGQKTPEEVVSGWMNSQGHRANIMSSSFTKIGVGYYQNAQGVNYWTQLFTY